MNGIQILQTLAKRICYSLGKHVWVISLGNLTFSLNKNGAHNALMQNTQIEGTFWKVRHGDWNVQKTDIL